MKLFCSLVVSLFASSQGLALEMNQFTQAYLEKSIEFQESRMDVRSMSARFEVAKKPEELKVGFSTAQSQPEAEGWTSTSLQEVELSTQMKLRTGTEVTAQILRQSNENNRSIFGFGDRESIRIVQPLWRNAFGREIRKNIEVLKQDRDQLEAQSQLQRQRSCSEGAQIFNNAFLQQEKVKLFRSQIRRLKTLNAKIRSLYQKQRIRQFAVRQLEIDMKSLQLDKALVEGEFLESKGVMESFGVSIGNELQAPNFKEQLIRETDRGTQPGLNLGEQKIHLANAKLRQAEEKTRTKLDLVIEAGKRRLGAGQNIIPFDASYGVVGIRMELPVLDPEARADVVASKIEKERAKAQNAEQERRFEEGRNKVQDLLPNISQQIQLNDEKITLLKKQITLFVDRLQSGAITFADLQNLNSQLAQQELKKAKLNHQLTQLHIYQIEMNGLWNKGCRI